MEDVNETADERRARKAAGWAEVRQDWKRHFESGLEIGGCLVILGGALLGITVVGAVLYVLFPWLFMLDPP